MNADAPAAAARPTAWTSWAAAIVCALVLATAGIGSHSIWTPDEPTGAAVGKAMWTSGDLVTPRLNGQPFLEKPPLYWWVQTAAFQLFGATDWTARLPSALFTALTLLVTYALARRLGGARQGLLALLVLWTTVQFCDDMGRIVVDPALVLFVALAHFGFAILEQRDQNEAFPATTLVAFALPLAFLAKGIVGIGLAAAPPALYLLATERTTAFRRLVPIAALALPLCVLFVAPWLLALYHEGGMAAVRENLIGNTLGRTLPTAAGVAYGHRNPAWYYLTSGVPALLPWLVALPAMLRGGLRGPRRLLFWTFALGVLLLSLPASKRTLYLVPLLPALAVCLAAWLDGLGERDGDRWDRRTGLALLGLAALVSLALAAVALGGRSLSPTNLAPLFARLSASGLVAFGVALLAVGLSILALLVHTLRVRGTPRAAWIVAPYLLLFLIFQTAGKALVDPLKDLHPLTAAIARLVPPPRPIVAYRPSESLLGIVGFDLNRTTMPLLTPEALEGYVASHPDALLVVALDDWQKLPSELRARFRPLYDETGFKASPYAVMAAR
ncbi:MAG TPA: glycosyltransferase family 39 protein [Thermoanaerobaculia bacterium]